MRPLHHTDTEPGWINRKFKDLDRQLRQLRTTTVVNLTAADPATLPPLSDFEQDDFTVTTPGTQTLALTYVPRDNSEHVYWNGLYQSAAKWSRVGSTITLPDPDDITAAGDKISVEYARQGWARRQTPASFVGVDSAVGTQGGLSVNVPIPAHSDGDVLLLFVARASDMDALAGWDLIGQVDAGAPFDSTLYAFTRSGDGVVSSVTVSTAIPGPSDVNVAAVALAYSGSIAGSSMDSLNPATSASVFTAPSTTAQMVVVAALYDGEGAHGSGSEVIAVSMSGSTRANLNCGSGNWSLAVAEGHGTFTDTSADADDHMWAAIAVGIDQMED